MSTAMHYGDEWAEANRREMEARRFHIISNYTGQTHDSAHVIAEARDKLSKLNANNTGAAGFSIIENATNEVVI